MTSPSRLADSEVAGGSAIVPESQVPTSRLVGGAELRSDSERTASGENRAVGVLGSTSEPAVHQDGARPFVGVRRRPSKCPDHGEESHAYSTCSQEELEYVQKRFGFSKKSLRLPRKGECICRCGPDSVAVLYDAFEEGLRFPFHPLVSEILEHYDLCISQISPQGWRAIIIFLFYAIQEWGWDDVHMPEFRHRMELRRASIKKGFYQFYFHPAWDGRSGAEQGWSQKWLVLQKKENPFVRPWGAPVPTKKNAKDDLSLEEDKRGKERALKIDEKKGTWKHPFDEKLLYELGLSQKSALFKVAKPRRATHNGSSLYPFSCLVLITFFFPLMQCLPSQLSCSTVLRMTLRRWRLLRAPLLLSPRLLLLALPPQSLSDEVETFLPPLNLMIFLPLLRRNRASINKLLRLPKSSRRRRS